MLHAQFFTRNLEAFEAVWSELHEKWSSVYVWRHEAKLWNFYMPSLLRIHFMRFVLFVCIVTGWNWTNGPKSVCGLA
jgi:hypothetical protein